MTFCSTFGAAACKGYAPSGVRVGGIGHHPGALPGRNNATVTESTSRHTKSLKTRRLSPPWPRRSSRVGCTLCWETFSPTRTLAIKKRQDLTGKDCSSALLSSIHVIRIRYAIAFKPRNGNFLVSFISIPKPIVLNTILVNRFFEPAKCSRPSNFLE